MLSSSAGASAPPRAFSPFRRVPLIVVRVESGLPLVRASGPRHNTTELRDDWFGADAAEWRRAMCGTGLLEACHAAAGEPFGRWIGGGHG